MQLAQISENIQRMRIENMANNVGNKANISVGGLHRNGLGSCRLSSSCPSLNKTSSPYLRVPQKYPQMSEEQHFMLTNGSGGSGDQVYFNKNSGVNRRRRMGASTSDIKSSVISQSGLTNRKHRRSHKPSNTRCPLSGSSADDSYDEIDSKAKFSFDSIPNRLRASSSALFVDANLEQNKSTPPNMGHQFEKSVSVSKPYHRNSASKKFANSGNFIFSQLHKSISTPSIAGDCSDQLDGHQAKGVGFRKKRNLPEPTHVFIQKLIAEHEWTRRSGTESEAEEDCVFSTGGHDSSRGYQRFSSVNVSNRSSSQTFLSSNQTSSPQLSLAEFLRDPSLEEGNHHKRRRKKERGSIFFRKKKDKPSAVKSTSLSLSKAPSAANLVGYGIKFPSGTSTVGGSARIPQYSYSMSSLKRPNSGPSGSGNGSNFYSTNRIPGNTGKLSDDRDELAQDDTTGLIEGEFFPGEEFPEGGPAAIRHLDTDPFLRIQDPEEPDSWQLTCSPADILGKSKLAIKRQEHMYEFIMTEKSHCQVLMVIQKLFIDGMHKYLNLSPKIIDRMFPCIDQLIEIHFKFLEDLRIRQTQGTFINSIADILLQQFSGKSADNWRESYGRFCSQHCEAVNVFKDLMKGDRRFNAFVQQCSQSPLLKKKGIPECILFVTTRITKYPLLIEPLIKTAMKEGGQSDEVNKLRRANKLVREILKDVNAKVAEKERDIRLMEIYHRIEAKSSVMFGGKKFKKSDILSGNYRRLMFEGIGTLQQPNARANRNLQVSVIVLSDIVIFLQENNQKFVFVTPEGKPGVIPVRTLIAREKTGAVNKTLYLISTTEKQPVMYEIEIERPPTRDDWIRGIRLAVDSCPPGSDSDMQAASEDEYRQHIDAKYLKLRHLSAEMRQKDIELSRQLETKMCIMVDMAMVFDSKSGDFYDELAHPDYLSLVDVDLESSCTKEQVVSIIQDMNSLLSSVFNYGSNSVNRSVSSVGEHQSYRYESPSLPRRAETFCGRLDVVPFDHPLQQNHESGVNGSGLKEKMGESGTTGVSDMQRTTILKISTMLNSLICMINEHFSSVEGLKIQLAESRERATSLGGRFKYNQQLEELRNLQDKLNQEKIAWQTEKQAKEDDIEYRTIQLNKQMEELDRRERSVREQRDDLYHKVEILRSQGIEVGADLTVITNKSDHHVESTPESMTNSVPLRPPVLPPPPPSKLNVHLLSATNENKQLATSSGDKKHDVKQQFPIKLSKLSISSSGLTSGNKQTEKRLSAKQSPRSDSSSNVVSQMLPLRLCESERRSSGSPKNVVCAKSSSSSYQKLSSSSFVEERRSTGQSDNNLQSTDALNTHKRTGSSPSVFQAEETAEENVIYF